MGQAIDHVVTPAGEVCRKFLVMYVDVRGKTTLVRRIRTRVCAGVFSSCGGRRKGEMTDRHSGKRRRMISRGKFALQYALQGTLCRRDMTVV